MMNSGSAASTARVTGATAMAVEMGLDRDNDSVFRTLTLSALARGVAAGPLP